MVKRVRDGLAELFSLPDGYEVVLGNGGATQFWDIATFCLIAAALAAPGVRRVLDEVRHRGPPGAPSSSLRPCTPPTPATHPSLEAEAGIDAYCWPHNETSTGVMTRVARPAGADAGALTLVDATSGAGGLPVDLRADRRLLLRAAEGVRLRRRPVVRHAVARGDRARRPSSTPTRWVPASLDLSIAIEQSRLEQTYNTPALATLFLMAEQLDWINGNGGLRWAVERTVRLEQPALQLGREVAVRRAVRRRPSEALVGRRHHRLDDAIDAAEVTKALRRNGIVDAEAYRAAGYNGLRVGMFPAIEPSDVEALTACIDWIVERL